MIYFTAHTINFVCHSITTMFRVLGVYNFGDNIKGTKAFECLLSANTPFQFTYLQTGIAYNYGQIIKALTAYNKQTEVW